MKIIKKESLSLNQDLNNVIIIKKHNYIKIYLYNYIKYNIKNPQVFFKHRPRQKSKLKNKQNK